MHAHHVEADPSDTEIKPRVSHLKFLTLTIAFLGIQFGWAIQTAFTTPLFLSLGVPNTAVSLIWLAGPISGLFVQPIVGAVSDGWYTRWGRRSPFIFVGGLCIILALGMISNAASIGKSIFHSDSNTLAIVLAVIGFWILDLANNTVQGPCRALLVDIAPPEQQGLGSAWFSFMLGTGNLVGYFIGSLNLLKIVPFMGTQYRALFTTAMIVLACCISVTLVTTKERVIITNKKIENPFKTIFRGILNMPSPVARVCVVQFFSWVGWFTYILFITDWVGVEIFHGNAKDPETDPARIAYDDGVRYASRALTYNAAVTMVFSIILPRIAHIIGLKLVYFIGQIILAACLISTYWIKTGVGASIVIAACGIPWTVTMVLPFTIIGQGVSASESGLYMGVLNIFVVLPQIVVSLFVPIIIKIFHHKVVAALVAGGISAFISSFFTYRLITPSFDKAETEETRPLVIKEAVLN